MSCKIELLSPAKNFECGIEAINHEADAVYIGASIFGARVATGNTLADIERRINQAHTYRAKVYITINTLLKNSELKTAAKLIDQCYQIGSDAIII